ncbi:hypothetical protein [Arthrobacter sp. HLT1-21]
MKLSKDQYIELADTFRDKAQGAHKDARTWMNRAIIAEARLSTLRTAYELNRRNGNGLTDVAGNSEPALPTIYPESE